MNKSKIVLEPKAKLELRGRSQFKRRKRSKEFLSFACISLCGHMYSQNNFNIESPNVWERLTPQQKSLIRNFVLEYEKIK
jgi:hypothetical protein